MSKPAASVAEKMAKLSQIPEQMLPSTLKHRTLLPNIKEIRYEYNRFAKEFGPMFQCYRLYVADLRFHNPHLKLQRAVTPDGPLIAKIIIEKANNSELITLEGAKFNSVEELRSKLIQINNEG